MADAEATPSEDVKSNTPSKPKSKQEDEAPPEEPAPAPARVSSVTPMTPPPAKPTRCDFWICLGLLVIFGLICAIGFIVIGVVVFGKSPESAVLNPRRIKEDWGVVNPSCSYKKRMNADC